MIARLRGLGSRFRRSESPEKGAGTAPLFTALRLFNADMLLSTGANLTLHYLRVRGERGRSDRVSTAAALAEGRVNRASGSSAAAAWVPLLAGAVACTVHMRQALNPSDRGHTATNLVNGAVVGLGLAAVLDGFGAAAKGETRLSMAPLLFGSSGLLGYLLDRQESVVAEEEAALQRRARIVERLVPERRTKIDKIVVRV